MLRVVATLAALACVFFAASGASADGSTDGVTEGDLPLMVLPLDALPDEYADLEINHESGFDYEEYREPDMINSYMLLFGDPGVDPHAGTAVALLTSARAAADSVAEEIERFGDYRNVETFPIADLGDSATGLVGHSEYDDEKVTEVIFTLGPVVGAAGAIRYDDADVRMQVEEMARTLFDRMKGVLNGEITDLPAPLPPDVNCDSAVTSVDATLILQLSAGLLAELRCGVLADANRDGTTNAIDATLILQYEAGLLDRLPV